MEYFQINDFPEYFYQFDVWNSLNIYICLLDFLWKVVNIAKYFSEDLKSISHFLIYFLRL